MITNNTLKILLAVNIVAMNSPIGYASPKEILNQSTYKPKGIRTNLHRLVQQGLVLRPYRGCFILSAKGREILNEALERGKGK